MTTPMGKPMATAIAIAIRGTSVTGEAGSGCGDLEPPRVAAQRPVLRLSDRQIGWASRGPASVFSGWTLRAVRAQRGSLSVIVNGMQKHHTERKEFGAFAGRDEDVAPAGGRVAIKVTWQAIQSEGGGGAAHRARPGIPEVADRGPD
jgi:reverse gyrase